jgi:predicted alpha/beta-hydrolase family hydrolase
MSSAAIYGEGLRGFLHTAAGPDGLVLTHGAGGNCESALLVAVAEAFAAAGVSVLRCDLPFRLARRFGGPSPANAASDRAGLRRAVEFLRGKVSGRIFLGGQSYGGRMASILAAEDPALAERLLLLSYPLHPPGRPLDLRTAHFPDIRIPVLFVQGTRDPFATQEELDAARKLIPAPTSVSRVEGAGHDLKQGKFDIAGLIVRPFLQERQAEPPADQSSR